MALRNLTIATALTLLLVPLAAAGSASGDEPAPMVVEAGADTLALAPSAAAEPGEGESILVDLAPGARLAGAEVVDPTENVVRVDVADNAVGAVSIGLLGGDGVQYVEPDIELEWFYTAASTNDPYVGQQWALAQTRTFGVRQPRRAPLIAMLDSGIDLFHPEFAGRLPNGRPKIAGVWNAVDGTTNVRDDLGHGTATASLASALTNNGHGIASVSPNSQILAVKVGGPGGLRMSDAIRGLDWAVKHGARVVNMSFGTTINSRSLRNATYRATQRGAVLVAAVGNEGCAADGGGNELNYPAGYSHVIGVAASDRRGRVHCMSNYGPEVDVTAPGVRVRYATMRGGAWGTLQTWSGYGTGSGTSFAAPQVAGAAALVRARHPKWSPDQVASALVRAARDVGPAGRDLRSGHGLLDVRAAVRATRHRYPDIREVNDDIPVARRQKPILKKGRTSTWIRASLHGSADRVDIYRVHVPAGRKLKLRLKTSRRGRYRLRVLHPATASIHRSRRYLRRAVHADSGWKRRHMRLAAPRAVSGGYWYVAVEGTRPVTSRYQLVAKVRS